MLSLTSSALYAQVLSYNVNQSNHRALELFRSYHLRLGCRSRAILGQGVPARNLIGMLELLDPHDFVSLVIGLWIIYQTLE
jgi:hypothetical protein